jgi:hypothetical protein
MEEILMLESFNAARVRRSNARRSRLEHNLLKVDLGRFASDVDLDRFDLAPTSSDVPDEQTRALRQLLALQIVTH